MRPLVLIAALVLVLDQASKYAILAWVMQPPQVIEVLPVFNLVLAINRGVSFSLLTSYAGYTQYLLSFLALAVCGGLLYWARSNADRFTNYAVGFIIGGALGNVIDRLRIGGVIDFLDVHWGPYHWPAFNVADSAIFIGAALLMLDALFSKHKSR